MTSCIRLIDDESSTTPKPPAATGSRKRAGTEAPPAAPPTPKRKRQASGSAAKPSDEFTLQCACISWLRNSWPGLRNKFTATVGGARLANGPKSYKKLEMMGYLKGVPDVLIFLARGPYHGLCVEFKTPTGKFQPNQREVHEALRDENYLVCVVRDQIDFRDIVDAYAKNEMHLVESMRLKLLS